MALLLFFLLPTGPSTKSSWKVLNLTFFHADFGKEFPSRTLWRGACRSCPSPSSALYPFLYRTEHFSEKGEKVPRKGEEEGWPAKGQKGKKDARKQVSDCFWEIRRRFLRMCLAEGFSWKKSSEKGSRRLGLNSWSLFANRDSVN